MTALVPLIEILACLGFGAVVLRLLGLRDEPTGAARLLFAFTVGFGILGWLLFFLGVARLFQPMWLWGVLLLGAAGTPLLVPAARAVVWERLDAIGWLLMVLFAIVFAFDVAEALSPPADADTLAYHFATPRQFIRAGGIEFILRPPDGAVPHLVQMSYVPALALGGERALMLWTMLTGWAAVAMTYVLARPHLPRPWALGVALLVATLPITLYAAGSGQVETRMALFAMVSAWAAGRALAGGDIRFAVLSGLTAGFYLAAKYLGLLFAAAVGVVFLGHRRRFVLGVAFGAATVLAGFQWYAWNALHTGDPVFPMLFQWLGRDDLALWSKAQDLYFKSGFMEIDRPIARTFLNMLLYPFWVTLDAPPATEGKLVGLGPYGLLVLPFALLGAWRHRGAIRRGPLLSYAVVALLFYVLWFMTGSSQRVRHLLPLAPVFLILMTVAAERFTRDSGLRRPLIAALGLTIVIQMAGAGLVGLKFVRHLAGGENREAYLRKNVTLYAPVPWINAHLTLADYLFIGERQLFYFLDVPFLFASPFTQSAVDIRPEQADAARLHGQLCAAGLTHVLLRRIEPDTPGYTPPAMDALSRTPLLVRLHSFEARTVGLRTLPGGGERAVLDIYRVEACRRADRAAAARTGSM